MNQKNKKLAEQEAQVIGGQVNEGTGILRYIAAVLVTVFGYYLGIEAGANRREAEIRESGWTRDDVPDAVALTPDAIMDAMRERMKEYMIPEAEQTKGGAQR